MVQKKKGWFGAGGGFGAKAAGFGLRKGAALGVGAGIQTLRYKNEKQALLVTALSLVTTGALELFGKKDSLLTEVGRDVGAATWGVVGAAVADVAVNNAEAKRIAALEDQAYDEFEEGEYNSFPDQEDNRNKRRKRRRVEAPADQYDEDEYAEDEYDEYEYEEAEYEDEYEDDEYEDEYEDDEYEDEYEEPEPVKKRRKQPARRKQSAPAPAKKRKRQVAQVGRQRR